MFKSFGVGTAAAMALGAVLLTGGLIGVRVQTALASDARAAAQEEELVANGVRGWVAEVENRLVGQTTWDEALKHLSPLDRAWAHENVGLFMHTIAGFHASYVLNGADRPVYASVGDRDGMDAVPAFKAVQETAAGLVAKVRAVERGRAFQSWRSHDGKPFAPDQASAIGLVDGSPAIVTASLVQSDFGKVRHEGPAPVVVTVFRLDEPFRAAFAERFLLRDLHVHAGSALPPEPSEASTVLMDGSRRPVARLDWTPNRPAWGVLVSTLPALLGALALFAALMAALFIRGRAAARALVASESRSKHMAYHDHLTGLPNRALFAERMAQALARLRRDGRPLGVVAIDLDRFKQVNDTHGHAAGDELIAEVARRLNALSRASDTVARLGGDEFAIICVGVTAYQLASVAQRVLDVLSKPVDMPFGQVFPAASIGLALIQDGSVDNGEAFRQADVALYRAKDQGRGGYCFYEPEMDQTLRARQTLERDLRRALGNGELKMVYQPQLDGERRMVGVEALVRWTHPERGPISPAFFVPIAEECGLIDALGEFTLRQAFRDSRRWPTLKVAINVSAVQLRSGRFPDMAARLIEETGADPRAIELELTEGVLLEDDETTHVTLSRLRDMGFSLALDDFGTGYSSLAYLRRYPVDKIKIDRSFITNLGVEKESEAVVAAIVKLARALNLEVIAEGVETEVQRAGLKRVGCSHVQGFLYSAPLSVEGVDQKVGSRRFPEPLAQATLGERS